MSIYNFRNFAQIGLDFNNRFNLFYGDNGSGKTALLEAIYFLSYGRSFRTPLNKRLIHNTQEKFTLFSRLFSDQHTQLTIGIEKDIQGDGEFKLAGEKAPLAEITALLPVLLLNNESFSLLTDGPTARRQFLDWGVFHVKHSFLVLWRNYQRALKQRNNAIKTQRPLKEIKNWNEPLVSAAQALSELRENYVNLFKENFKYLLNTIYEYSDLTIKYYRGWPDDTDLNKKLNDTFQRDMELGYTYYGAHRADIKFMIKGKPIEDVLSRGQQKIVAWLMKFTQSILLKELTEKQAIILVDDLGAELDSTRREALIALFQKIKGQYFITAIDSADLSPLIRSCQSSQWFHVKQGLVFSD